jgi:hypothetical protein
MPVGLNPEMILGALEPPRAVLSPGCWTGRMRMAAIRARTWLTPVLHCGWRAGYQVSADPLSGMAPFHAWAGALMPRELTPRLGRADLPWLTDEWLAGVQRWTDSWRSRANRAA